jgi:phenylalanyl-tRNA synthetase alpha chain
MREGKKAFLCTGDVYRRDEIDSSHYPVFHQMEGVKIFEPSELPNPENPTDGSNVKYIEDDLKDHLEGMVQALFGPNIETRWVDAYFPFTDPSLELEVFFQGDWLEVLGSGVIERKILTNCDLGHTHGWAFGLGLERLAMVLFDIPDIRLFWTEDPRFSSQFRAGEVTTFKPYSKYPECYKDVSFWRPEDFHENDLCDMVRGVAGDLVEKVELIDQFRNEKLDKTSFCYRIVYRSMDRSLTNEEVDVLQNEIRDRMSDEMDCELR